MVLAERSNDVRNGKRSRGPSPNGHGSPDSSSEDENGTRYSKFRVAYYSFELLLFWGSGSFLHVDWYLRFVQHVPIISTQL